MRTLADIQQQLGVSLERGLPRENVARSRADFGANHLTPLPRQPLWQKFLEKFDEPIIKILLAAALLSMVVDLFRPPFEGARYTIGGIAVAIVILGLTAAFILRRDWIPGLLFLSAFLLFPVGLLAGHASYDGLAVMIAVILATGVAFASEYKSDREFEILNAQKESLQVKVTRGGDFQTIPLEDVVVGDVVTLEMGDEIPADGRLIKANELHVDQSLMTGESEPVRKQVKPGEDAAEGPEKPGCLYRGTHVVDGIGALIVTEVGDATYLGQIARRLSADTDEEDAADTEAQRIQRRLTVSKALTPLQQKLERLAGLISKVGYVAAAAIFVALLVRGVIKGEVRWPRSAPLTLSGHPNPISDLAFTPDGKLLASVSWTVKGDDLVGEVKLWDPAGGQEVRALQGHQDLVSALAFSKDGRLLATGGKDADSSIIIWDVASGRKLQTLVSAPAEGRDAKKGHSREITSLAFDARGQRLASASRDEAVKVWEVATGALVSTYSGHRGEVLAVAFHPDGKHVASGGHDRVIHVWNAANAEPIDFLRAHGSNPVAQMFYSPDGKLLASTATRKTGNDPLLNWYISITDPMAKKQVNELAIPHAGAGLTLRFVDDRRIAFHTDGPVQLWDVRDIKTTPLGEGVRGPAFTSDGSRSAWVDGQRIVVTQGAWETLLASGSALLSYFMYMVIIIVVAVPEGLPMSVTVSLALAMRKMTRANSLVRQLVACETIGSATVICSDKTGTLTQNKMQLARLGFDTAVLERETTDWSGQIAACRTRFSGEPSTSPNSNPSSALEWIVLNAAVNSTANLETREGKLVPVGNSTEGALLQWLHEAQLDYQRLRLQFPSLYQIHFSSDRKRMTTVIRRDTSLCALVKGAPEQMLEECRQYVTADGRVASLTPAVLDAIRQRLRDAARHAMRTLAFGYAVLPADLAADEDSLHAAKDRLHAGLVYVGFAAIRDPLRPDVKEALAECRGAGIGVKMITGDNIETARAIGAEIGLIDPSQTPDSPAVMTSDEFNQLGDDDIKARLPGLAILARARPLDKFRMVRLLQEQGEVVAVTGDGTNDAPALKKADVGLAMGRAGTEVAKEASKIVLLDDAFSTIVKAVHWGRALYENIQRFIQFQLTINVSALLIAFLGPFFGVKPPFTILQLLWINVIMDTLAAIALCSEPPRAGLMRQPPKRRDESILTPRMLTTIFTTAGFFVVVMMLLLLAMENQWWPVDDSLGVPSKSFPELSYWQVALFFSVYVFFQVWNEINCRSLTPEVSGFHRLFRNPVFLGIVGLIIVGQVIIVTFGGPVFEVAPLGVWTWLAIAAFTASVLLYAEIVRQIRLARMREAASFPSGRHGTRAHSAIEYRQQPLGDPDGRFERRPPGRGQ